MKKTRSKMIPAAILLLCMLFILSISAEAAPKSRQSQSPKQAKQVNTWVTKNGRHYYYNAQGKKSVGMTKIGSRTYYFDSKGIERYGWKKIKNNYYYFRLSTATKGAYMLKSTTVNGIRLDSKGRAKKSGSNARKLRLMVVANRTVEKITSPGMNKAQRLRACFNYVKKNYTYYTWREFTYKPNWEKDFAEDMFFRNGRGDCFSYAAAFAYLAGAVGMKNVYVISSGGHGWTEINGKVYDPDWALVSNVDSYFGMSYDLSGVNGRPNYKSNRAYAVKI